MEASLLRRDETIEEKGGKGGVQGLFEILCQPSVASSLSLVANGANVGAQHIAEQLS